MRRHMPLIIPLFAAAVFAVVTWLQNCNLGAEHFTVAGFGLTFAYPDEMQLRHDVGFAPDVGTAPADAVALTRNPGNRIVLARYGLDRAVTADNLPAARADVQRTVRRLDPAAGPGRRVQAGGFPAVQYELAGTRGPGSRTTHTALFVGSTKYVISCQSTENQHNEVRALCDRIVHSLDASEDAGAAQ